MHYAVAGFFEVALRLLVEGVLQGHVGGQANNEAGDAEGCHEDGDKARTQVGTYPSSSGDASGFLMLFQAARRRTKKFLGEGAAPSRAGVPARRGRVASLSGEAGSPGE